MAYCGLLIPCQMWKAHGHLDCISTGENHQGDVSVHTEGPMTLNIKSFLFDMFPQDLKFSHFPVCRNHCIPMRQFCSSKQQKRSLVKRHCSSTVRCVGCPLLIYLSLQPTNNFKVDHLEKYFVAVVAITVMLGYTRLALQTQYM